MSSDESVCSSCFFPRHGHWLRVKEENCANLSSLPTHAKLMLVPKPHAVKIITDQKSLWMRPEMLSLL